LGIKEATFPCWEYNTIKAPMKTASSITNIIVSLALVVVVSVVVVVRARFEAP